VELAERVNGVIPRPVEFDYIWGDALAELDRAAVDLRIINLETSVTSSEDYWRRLFFCIGNVLTMYPVWTTSLSLH
jgi:poly-gamma-glutamate capsule biosynthesis protein CapA/YwtB (metallophosphatase superfamily)